MVKLNGQIKWWQGLTTVPHPSTPPSPKCLIYTWYLWLREPLWAQKHLLNGFAPTVCFINTPASVWNRCAVPCLFLGSLFSLSTRLTGGKCYSSDVLADQAGALKPSLRNASTYSDAMHLQSLKTRKRLRSSSIAGRPPRQHFHQRFYPYMTVSLMLLSELTRQISIFTASFLCSFLMVI